VRRCSDNPVLKTQAAALYVVQEALVAANCSRFITLALGARMPTSFVSREFAQAGASRAVLSCSASQMGASSLVENLVSLCVRHDERSSLRDFLELDGPDICHHRPQSPRYFLHRFADKSLIGNFNSLSF
jgi:hypothetical protein